MALTKVSGHIIDQPFDVGIITATNQYVSGIGTFGNIRVLGDLQVDGTTTTLDTVVTEVDRLEVGANNSTVGLAVTQSGSGDAAIFMGGSVGIGTDNPALRAHIFSTANADAALIESTQNFATLRFKSATNTSGPTIGIDGAGGLQIDQKDTSKYIAFAVGTERLRIDAAGNVGVNQSSINSTRKVEITQPSAFASALRINTAGSAGNPGYVEWNTGSSNYKIGVDHNSDNIRIKRDAATLIRIDSAGNLNLESDTAKFTAGAGNDLQIFHNGSHNHVRSVNGNLYLQDDDYIEIGDTSGKVSAGFIPGGASNLRHNGSKKLETTSTGVTVTGNISCGDDQRIKLGNDQDLLLYHDGANSYLINETGDLNIRNLSDDKDVMIQSDNGSGGFETYIQADGSTRATKLFNSGSVKLETSSGGVNVTGELNVTTKVAFPDSAKAIFGAGDDLQIYHTGSTSYISDQGTGALRILASHVRIKNANDNESIANFGQNGAVELYYDNSLKFETTTTGAKVTGALEVTQEYPSIRPILDLNFAATKTLDRRITFTRNSVGTFTDELGIVRYASNNTPRFDHDPTTGESLGLLIEESRTNLITTNILDWNASSGVILNDNAGTAPDGTNTAVKIIRGAPAAYQNANAAVVNVSTGTPLIMSWYLKAVEVDSIYFQTNDGGWINGTFDISGGGLQGSGGNLDGHGMYAVGNGWYRCWVKFDSASSSLTLTFHPATSSPISGNGSDGALIWGVQLEAGSHITSYIPTNGSTVTRDQDSPLITGTDFTDFYNQSEGTLVLSSDIGYLATANQAAVVFEDTSNQSASFIAMGYNTGGGGSGHVGAWYNSSGTTSAFKTHNIGITINTEFRQAFAYKLNDFASVANGTTPLTDNSGALTSLIDRVRFGHYHYDGITSGHIRQFKYYPKRLPNAQLQGLTQQ